VSGHQSPYTVGLVNTAESVQVDLQSVLFAVTANIFSTID